MEQQEFFNTRKQESARKVEYCEDCGVVLDNEDFGLCTSCTHMLDRVFIMQLGLVEGQHYTRDAAGHIEYWLGDNVLHASALWMAWRKRYTPQQLAPLVQALLAGESPFDVVGRVDQD